MLGRPFSPYQVLYVVILNVEPLKTTDLGWAMGGRVGRVGDHDCACDSDSCQSLASMGKEGRALGRKGLWSREPQEAELCDLG